MVVLAGLSVPFVALQFSVDVQLFAASAGGLLGMLAVRKRCSPQDEANDAWMPGRTIFRYDANRLAIVGNAMLQKTRKKKQPLSIVVLDFSDLPELQFVCKGEARDMGPTIERMLQGVAPAKGAVVRTGPTTFAVLLPNFDARKALRAVHEAFGKACCFEFALGDNEMLLMPDYLVKTIHNRTESLEDVYQVLCDELRKGQLHAERRQIYLRRERESHSRPSTLSSNRDAQLPDTAAKSAWHLQ